MKNILIDGNSLTLEELVKVARKNCKVNLKKEATIKIKESRKKVDYFLENDKKIYGINTGFGKFSDVIISKEESKLLQKNLIISHAVGAGDFFSRDIVRAIMLLRVNALSKGYSGIRLSTVETLIEMINKQVHPLIPEKGSLGASGDLAPLAHMVLPMIGLVKVEYKGEICLGEEGMKLSGIKTIELTSKEGLALINGTQVMTAVGALTLYDGIKLSKLADISAGLSFEAQNGIITALDERVHEVRPHKGQKDTAKNLLNLLDGSKMTTEQGDIRVQDAYSLRCTPQVHGASKDALNYIKEKVLIEINSVTDNPIIFDETGISGGNFHGQPVALPFDFMSIALAELANISERRLERLVNPSLSKLPAFLVEKGGLNSGFMIVQYSAASLVSENKTLSHPSSVDSIPSSANQEDHVSMGTIGARKVTDMTHNSATVIAIELLAACQALDLNIPKKLSPELERCYDLVRQYARYYDEDRYMAHEIDAIRDLVLAGAFV